MLEQKLHICPRRRPFTDVENEIGFRRQLLTLVNIAIDQLEITKNLFSKSAEN